MSVPGSTIVSLVARGAGEAPAIMVAEGPALSYGELGALVERTVPALNRFGIGRSSRLAMVLPNGPLLGAAFVACACATAVAPLNPHYRSAEFARFLASLKPDAIVLEPGEAAARSAASELGIPVIELTADRTSPAQFTLDAPVANSRSAGGGGDVQRDDIALLLPTSGTTGGPKIVPLRHQNLVASADNIRRTLGLGQDDCSLNLMPLFHGHGIIGALLASLAAGASVCCLSGGAILRMPEFLGTIRPSWYTAVPTLHQAILKAIGRHGALPSARRLRFVRSCSAALPPPLMKDIEAALDVPCVEAYGMTEASHQIATNPLPPGLRFPGSVGVPGGAEIRILGEMGDWAPHGTPGEVAIRGPGVIDRYEAAESINRASFHDGWLRTGDRGAFDERGYLRLEGRLKELINRGGEKISPLEVEAAVLEHPSVEEAVAFAVPDARLTEDVAIAVVTRSGCELAERDLRSFVAERLASFKVPRKIIFCSEIPKGATGKIRRLGLAEMFSMGL